PREFGGRPSDMLATRSASSSEHRDPPPSKSPIGGVRALLPGSSVQMVSRQAPPHADRSVSDLGLVVSHYEQLVGRAEGNVGLAIWYAPCERVSARHILDASLVQSPTFFGFVRVDETPPLQ